MIHFEKLPETDIYAISFDGSIDRESMHNFADLLDQETTKNKKIKLLASFDKIPAFEDFKAFTETMKMKFKAISAVGKYAVLSEKDWVEKILPIGNFLTPGMPLKHFKTDDRQKAIEWLESDEV